MQPGMRSLLRAAGADRGPYPAATSWQLDVILAQRAEASSYTRLNSADITAARAAECVGPCVRDSQARPAAAALRVPVTRLASLATHNVTVPYGRVCAK